MGNESQIAMQNIKTENSRTPKRYVENIINKWT